jgi:large subunit ribosomal protein L44
MAGTSSAISSTSRSFASSTSISQDGPRLHLAPLAAKDPLLFDTLRPRPESAFVALAHRLRLISPKTDEQTKNARVKALIQACTHPSFVQLITKTIEEYGGNASVGTGKGFTRNKKEEEKIEKGKETDSWFDGQYLEASPEASNEALSALGNSLLGLIASEHLHLRYPNLPTRVLKAALSAYVGPNTLADVAAEMGISAKGIVRWDRQARKVNEDPVKGKALLAKRQQEKLLSRDVHVDALRSIIAIIFQEKVRFFPGLLSFQLDAA